MSEPILYRGIVDGYVDDRTLEWLGQDVEGDTVCRMFSTTVSGYLLFLTTDSNATTPTINRVTWERLNDAPNSLGQQGASALTDERASYEVPS